MKKAEITLLGGKQAEYCIQWEPGIIWDAILVFKKLKTDQCARSHQGDGRVVL